MKINLDKIKETANISLGAFILSIKLAVIYLINMIFLVLNTFSILCVRDKS